MSMESSDLQNKAVAAEDAGVSGDKSTDQDQSAEPDLDEDAAKLASDAEADAEKVAHEAVSDAEAAAGEVKDAADDVAHGDVSEAVEDAKNLVEKVVDEAKDLADEVLSDVASLAEEAKEVVEDAVDWVKAKLGSENDEEHDAALRAQYDATHELAAAGGDRASDD